MEPTIFRCPSWLTIEGFVRKANLRGASVYITGAKVPIRRALLTHGVRPPRVRFKSGVPDAIAAAHAKVDPTAPLRELQSSP